LSWQFFHRYRTIPTERDFRIFGSEMCAMAPTGRTALGLMEAGDVDVTVTQLITRELL
jgi:hypothetical protein